MASHLCNLVFKGGGTLHFRITDEQVERYCEKFAACLSGEREDTVILSEGRIQFHATQLAGYAVNQESDFNDKQREFMQKVVAQLDEGETWKGDSD